jgi:hypothetical protein
MRPRSPADRASTERRRGLPVVAWTAGAAVALFYAVLGLLVLAPEAVYSGDIGVKYVQAEALADHRFTSLDIPYPGELLDPGREFFPLRPPFVMTTAGETQAIFPPASALIQAVAVSWFGFRGMIALSIVAAATIIAASLKLAPSDLGLPVVIAVGLGGPLWFYAVSGWEHAPAVALGAAGFAVAARSAFAAGPAALIAGALVAAGATLRDEVLLLAPGLLLTIWLRHRAWRPIGLAVAGFAIPLLAAAAIEVWWFGRPPAAHLRHAVHLLQTALHVTAEPNPDVPVLRPMTTRERYDTVVTYWLLGRGTDPQVAAFVAGLVVALVVRWKWQTSLGILLWLVAFGATAATDLWEVLTAPKWLAGLVRVSPYVVLALLPLARRDRDSSFRLRLAIGVTTAAYLVIAFAGVDTSGGKSLGPRLLLPLLPLLTVSSVMAMASYLRSSSRIDRAVGWAGSALLAMAVAIHLGGTIPAYMQRNADDSSAVLAAAASGERIVVADDMYTAQLLFPLYDRKIVLLADSTELGQRLGTVLADRRLPGALLISRNPEPAVTLPPLRVDRTEQKGRMVIQYWRR